MDYQKSGDLHFITFSCYRRSPLLGTPQARRAFEQTLERVRRWYGLCVFGYVVMPDHVHLLMDEPERSSLSVAIQMLNQVVARKLRPTLSPKRGEEGGAPTRLIPKPKGRATRLYIYNNPVRAGLASVPEKYPHGSLYLRRVKAQGLKPVIETANGGTTKVVPRRRAL